MGWNIVLSAVSGDIILLNKTFALAPVKCQSVCHLLVVCCWHIIGPKNDMASLCKLSLW